MTYPLDDTQRSPKGDHNRRIALGYNIDEFAALAGVDPEALHSYEATGPDDDFDADVAHKVGTVLEKLEAQQETPTNGGHP